MLYVSELPNSNYFLVGYMLPTVFLSLSGHDSDFVSRVHKSLPDGLAYYYPKSFENGENLIEAMESRVNKSSIFVLFASRASVSSVWVKFEIDRARIAKIKSKEMRILVFPTESGIAARDLPNWMTEYWIGGAGSSPRDIARYIRNILTGSFFEALHSSQVFGRGGLVDQVCNQYLTATVTNKVKPNVLIFGGYEGIGRRTVAKEVLKRTNPALPEVIYGPEFSLPQFADLEDIYRSLRQEIDDSLSIEMLSAESDTFRSLSQQEQVKEVSRCLSYFGKLNQAVWLITGNGIFEDRGTLKGWVPQLFDAAAGLPEVRLCVISNRLIHEAEARPFPNVFQISVGNISDSDI